MAIRIKVLCEHGISVDFVSDTLTGASDIIRDINRAKCESLAEGDGSYICYSDALGNQIVICKERIVAILTESLTPDEAFLLQQKQEEKSHQSLT